MDPHSACQPLQRPAAVLALPKCQKSSRHIPTLLQASLAHSHSPILLQANVAHLHSRDPAAGHLGSFPFPPTLLQANVAQVHYPEPAAGQLGRTQLLGLPSLCPPTSFWRGSCSRHMPALLCQGTLQPSRPATQRTASTALNTSLVGPLNTEFSQCACLLAHPWYLTPGCI